MFGLIANFQSPRVCDFGFMAKGNLRIYMEFDRENRLHSQSLSTIKSLVNFQISYFHEIKIASIEIMKICRKTKIRVLNMILGSEISHDVS